MFKQVECAAKEEKRTKSEIVREALHRYIEDRKWQSLRVYGSAKVQKLGLQEGDAEKLLQEYRKPGIDRELALSLKDVKAGRVRGPFTSVDDMRRSLRKTKQKAGKK